MGGSARRNPPRGRCPGAGEVDSRERRLVVWISGLEARVSLGTRRAVPKVTSRSQEERWMKRYAWALLGLGLWVAGMEGGTRWALGQTPPPTIGPQQNRSFNPATAIPILRGTGKALDSLVLSCPTTMGCAYSAYWDGYVGNTGKQALSGVYIYQLVIDGKRVTRKIVVK